MEFEIHNGATVCTISLTDENGSEAGCVPEVLELLPILFLLAAECFAADLFAIKSGLSERKIFSCSYFQMYGATVWNK